MYSRLLLICVNVQRYIVKIDLLQNYQDWIDRYTQSDKVAQCYDCRVDESCVICYQCYKNGNHEGHKVIFRKSAEGCCDCGDLQAWESSGFCRDHTGQFIDIEIQQDLVDKFCGILQDVLYIYFRLKVKQQCNSQMFNSSLFNLFTIITRNGIKAIKLISIAFSKLPAETHLVNTLLSKQSFLHSFLNYKLVGDHMKKWERVFINMFPYYTFKKSLIKAYMSCFYEIYAGDKQADSGQSIACQILTSYKLVEDYIQTEGSIPLGFELHKRDYQASDMVLVMMLVDFQRINFLQGDVPYKYWKFHITHGITNLFSHYQVLKVKYQKYMSQIATKKGEEEHSVNSFLICNTEYFQNQQKLLKVMNQTVLIIKQDKQLLMLVLLKTYQLIMLDSNQDFIIFRPYDRLFSLALFHLLDSDLNVLTSLQFRQKLRGSFNISFQNWNFLLKKLMNRMFSTYMFFSHILINQKKGYHSSFYEYLYFYQIQDKFMSNIDILQLKMIMLLSEQSPIIQFEEIARINNMQPKQWNLNIFRAMIQEIGLLYIAKTPQIFIAHYNAQEAQREQDIYKQEICQYLRKFLTAEGAVCIDKIVQFSSCFLFKNKELLKVYLQSISDYDKNTKLFKIKQKDKDQGCFNYRDFQLRAKLKNYSHSNQNPKFTLQFITTYNKDLFQKIWNYQNLERIKSFIMRIYEKLNVAEERQNVADLICIVCKMIYLLSQVAGDTGKANIFKQILSDMHVSWEMVKELKFYDNILSQIVQQHKDQVQQKMSKKDLLLAKKKRKMQQIKKTQSENINLAKIIHEEEILKLNLIPEQQQNKQCCAICHNRQKSLDDTVYLVSMKIRDIQKLLGLGKGVKTLSFTTCYHMYHYSCIQTRQIRELSYFKIFKCPICRTHANICLPVQPITDNLKSRQFLLACLQRITLILTKGRRYEAVNVVEQLLKSFYHYVLLSQYDFNYLLTRRRKLYQIILKMLSNTYFLVKLQSLQYRLEKSTINIRPKQRINRRTSILNIFNNHADGWMDIQNEQDLQMQLGEAEQMQIQEEEEAQRQNIHMPYYMQFNRAALQSYKNKKKINKDKILKTTNVFKYSLKRIIRHLQDQIRNQLFYKKENQQEQNDCQQYCSAQENFVLPQVESSVVAVVDDLLSQENILKTVAKSSEIHLQVLPEIYNWDMTKNICEGCKQVGIDTMKCLLCAWRGCVKCKSSNMLQHVQKMHGEICPFMCISNAKCYLIGQDQSAFLGYLYANEWGQKFNIKKQWRNFSFQQNIYDKIKQMLLRDE